MNLCSVAAEALHKLIQKDITIQSASCQYAVDEINLLNNLKADTQRPKIPKETINPLSLRNYVFTKSKAVSNLTQKKRKKIPTNQISS